LCHAALRRQRKVSTLKQTSTVAASVLPYDVHLLAGSVTFQSSTKDFAMRTSKGGIKLDRLDLRILSHLQKAGRATHVEIADAIGLSPSPCLVRVRRLEEAGFITGYAAHVQLEKLGDTLVVFTEVTLQDHKREDFARFENSIRGIDEIVECHFVSGGYDYLLKFVTRGVTHYQELTEKLLAGDMGIEKYFSYIVMKTPFVKSHFPVERLLESGD
jgi:DNA-binding Lrp family transcriptional regulator